MRPLNTSPARCPGQPVICFRPPEGILEGYGRTRTKTAEGDGTLNLQTHQGFKPMSEEQLKAFIAKVQADRSLQEQLKAEGADLVAIAKGSGFAITEAEVKAYQTRELSDDELEGVAGRFGYSVTCPGSGWYSCQNDTC